MAYLIIESIDSRVKALESILSEQGIIDEGEKVWVLLSASPRAQCLSQFMDRGTGRTTNMLKTVMRNFLLGKESNIIVIGFSVADCNRMLEMACAMTTLPVRVNRDRGIMSLSEHKVRFFSKNVHEDVFREYRPDAVYVDHYAMEQDRVRCLRIQAILGGYA